MSRGINDQQARGLARTYANDVCVCTHTRDEHTDRSGAPRRCQSGTCACTSYAYDRRRL